jgi:hypothetical protein
MAKKEPINPVLQHILSSGEVPPAGTLRNLLDAGKLTHDDYWAAIAHMKEVMKGTHKPVGAMSASLRREPVKAGISPPIIEPKKLSLSEVKKLSGDFISELKEAMSKATSEYAGKTMVAHDAIVDFISADPLENLSLLNSIIKNKLSDYTLCLNVPARAALTTPDFTIHQGADTEFKLTSVWVATISKSETRLSGKRIKFGIECVSYGGAATDEMAAKVGLKAVATLEELVNVKSFTLTLWQEITREIAKGKHVIFKQKNTTNKEKSATKQRIENGKKDYQNFGTF